uniref:Protein brunelleschi-like n=1 Tax=Hirondellea gigas TaxID=1518452 RepID=A0A6A7FTM0_9CRUS
MRSSVSVILSSPPPDTTMSYPDYQAHPHHHRSLLVLVAQLGTRVKSRSFQQLYDRISRVNQLKVSDSGGIQRPVWVTYRKEYPVENNDWGDFQTHRRLLAIITIGQVASQNDLNEVCKQHESLKVKYASTIYDSRCIILGLNADGSVHTENDNTSTDESSDTSIKQEEGKLPHALVGGGGADNVFTHGGDRDSGVYEHLPHEDNKGLTNGDLHHVNGHIHTATVGGSITKKRCDSSSQSDSGQSTGAKNSGHNGLSSSSSDSGSESTADDRCVTEADASVLTLAPDSTPIINSSTSPDYCTQLSHDSLHDNTSNCSINSSTNNLNDASNYNNGNNTQQLNNTNNLIGFNFNNSTTSSSSNNSSGGSGQESSQRDILQPPSYFKTRAMFYPTSDHAVNIETTLHEFISSLFWVLESKRLDKSQEKLDRPPLLCAPFERKDLVGLDLDSRASRKRCVGRLKKQLGDLCLQVGLVGEAAQHYSQAADILRACNDWLWLAGSLEGSCAASAVQLYPELGRGCIGLHRNSSLGIGPTALKHRQTNSLPSNSLPSGLSPTAAKHLSKHCLTSDNLINKYREAIVHYSKYRNAGVVETEASIKAVFVLIEQRRYLLAAEFLSNVVFINLQLSDEEKIGRFRALAELYQELGMMRKAGFFRRVAAMRCAVAQTQRSHDWPQCYRLLLNTLPGYRLTLDPLYCINGGGWGALQVQLIQEVVGTSRRMGAHEACCRHQAFLLAALLHHLTPAQRQEAALMLHTLTHQAAQAAQSNIASDNTDTINGGNNSNSCSVASSVVAVSQPSIAAATPHNMLPTVNLLNIPLCRTVKVLAPKDGRHLQKPAKASAEENTGPFIFSPFASLSHATNKPNNVFDFQWIEGDVCEVALQLYNCLTIPLQLSNIRLVTEGKCQLEAWSSSIVLEAESASTVTLRGQPTSPGQLRITGYSVTALGITSTCRFKHLPHLKAQFYIMEVVPALPLLQVESEGCDNNNTSNNNGGVTVEGGVGEGSIRGTLLAGETRQLKLTLHNISAQPVTAVSVTLKTKMNSQHKDRVFKVDEAALVAQLPILGNSSSSISLALYGLTDFLAVAFSEQDDASSIAGQSGSPSLPSSSLTSVPLTRGGGGSSRLGGLHRSSQYSAARSQSSGSMMSSHSGGSSTRSDRSCGQFSAAAAAKNKPAPNVVEGDVEVWYTGQTEEHWRVCHLSVKLQVTPTLQVIRWDVLPGDQSDQCYLVLDLLNRSSSEMELTYTTDGRRILVQAGDSCRVPVPVTRCPRDASVQSGERSVSEALGSHVSSQVRLQWLLSPQDISCHAALPQLHFALHTHHLMMLAPITWGVCVDDVSIMVGGECSGKVGESVAIKVTISNNSDTDLPPLHLSITTYQDHQNGNTNYRTDGVVAAAGAMAATVPKLSIGESYSKQVNLVFFTGGVYKVELRCCPTVSTTTAVTNSSSITTPSLTNVNSSITNVSAHHNSSSNHHHSSHYNSHHGAYHHAASPPTEVWMFAPAIELTISH